MKFTIGFEKEDKKELYSCFDDIIQRGSWSEGIYVQEFEEKWASYVGTKFAVAFSSWYGAALAALSYFGVKNMSMLCPSNTFAATPLSVMNSNMNVYFTDCNREDLCMSVESILESLEQERMFLGCFLVHIGGHIAFDTMKIRDLCRQRGLFLLEDCAHAHGASWDGKKAGTFGDAGIYSFYATKTITTGEGGMLVTNNKALALYAQEFRNYGKPRYAVRGGNFRMSEFTAAIGVLQTKRLDDIVAWKKEYADRNYKGRYQIVEFPVGMKSGYYKYIIFDEQNEYNGPTTGAVYDTPCHYLIHGKRVVGYEDNRNSIWVSKNHKCLPLYYKGEES